MGFLIPNLVVNGIVEGLITGLMALSVAAVFSIARFPNAATGDFATGGAYLALLAYSTFKTGLVIAAVIGALGTAAVAAVFYGLVFRKLIGRPFIASLLASIGIAFITRHVMALIVGHEPVMLPLPVMRAIPIGGLYLHVTDLIIIVTTVVVLLTLWAVIRFTPIGRDMRAIADNDELAQISGIQTRKVLTIIWLLAGGVAGIAGLMVALKSPIYPELGWNLLMAGFAGAIVGGLNSLPGAVLGGLIIGVTQEVSTVLLGSSYKLITPFIAILIVLLIRPSGLFGHLEKIR